MRVVVESPAIRKQVRNGAASPTQTILRCAYGGADTNAGLFCPKRVYAVDNFRKVDRMKRSRWAVCAFLVLFGVLLLLNSLDNPRLSGLHGADRIKLIASGLCLGVGFGLLLGGRKFPGE